MANVWFVRRVGGRWKAPGGKPMYQRPLGELIFKLDLGWQRRLGPDMHPDPLPGSSQDPQNATKVFVEVTPSDLEGEIFSGYQVGWYDSPYSPAEAVRRLGPGSEAGDRGPAESAPTPDP